MSRLRNVQTAGFYPFLPEHFPAVAAQMRAPDNPVNTWLLDPCAGEGVFARFLATHYGLKLATIEINEERGQLCRQVADHHVTGDALEVELHKRQFAFLWSNPPFVSDGQLRMEWRFLRYFLDALVPGGVLAYTIPRRTMAQDPHILRHLVEFYEDHRLYYLPDPNPYAQVVLFARKRAERVKLGKAGAGQLLTTMMNPPLLPPICDNPLPIPTHPLQTIVLRGTQVDWDQLRAEAAASPGPDLGEAMTPPGVIEGRSLMPPRRGHVASLMAGGGLDNTRVGPDVVKGYVRQEQEEQPISDDDRTDGVTELTRTIYVPQIVRFNPSTGDYTVFDGERGVGDYLTDNAATLSQALIKALDPAYTFDLDDQPDETKYILKNMAKHIHVPGKPRGLWPGQQHVGAALDTAFRSPSPLQAGGTEGGLGLKGAILVASMGWGKSIECAAQLALYYRRQASPLRAGGIEGGPSPKPSWVVTEPHLVEELASTIKNCYPSAYVEVLNDVADVRRSLDYGHDTILSDTPRIAVMSKETLKNGSGFRPAVIPDRRFFKGLADEDEEPLLAFRCPDCGRLQVYSHDCRLGHAGEVVTTIAYFNSKPRRCCYDVTSDDQGNTKRLGCGRPEHYQLWERNLSDRSGFLYQQARTIGTTGIYAGRGQDGFQRLSSPLSALSSAPSRPGLARIPIADYLARLHTNQVGLFVWDEAHNAKGQATDAGHALATIAQVADHVLLMTGTLFGGAASSVFFLAHRISPEFRRRWRFDQLQAFVERYGVLEKKVVEKEIEVESRGTLSTKTRKNTYVKELPGCSPALVSLFLGFTIFTGLSDLGISLPPVRRRIVNAELDPDHAAAYAAYEDACRDIMDEMKEQDVDLAGSFLHTLRGYAVAPWRPEYLKWKVRQPVNGRLRHTETRIFNVAPSLQWQCATCGRTLHRTGTLDNPQRLRCDWCSPNTKEGEQAWQQALANNSPLITHHPRIFAPERALLDEILAQKARGRRCIVFVSQTDTRDIVPRLLDLCEQHAIRARRCDVSPRKRRAWFEKYGPFLDATFVNPEACKTGLNLIMFQTAIWYEIPYSLYTIKQASARIRRPTSQADVIEEVYVNVPGTIVEDALALVMEKFTAASIFRGESAEQALLTVRGSGNFTAELISRVVRRAQSHTDDGPSELVEDLETLFSRYNELEETGELALTDAPETDTQAKRVKQVADEFKERAAEVTNWAASQLSLF
jgi:predicted RNA methylase